ncbi:unnamed protein product [Leuciscus chuanchicus]
MDFEKRCCTHTRCSLLTHTQCKVHAQTTTIMIANVMSAVDGFKTQADSTADKCCENGVFTSSMECVHVCAGQQADSLAEPEFKRLVIMVNHTHPSHSYL